MKGGFVLVARASQAALAAAKDLQAALMGIHTSMDIQAHLGAVVDAKIELERIGCELEDLVASQTPDTGKVQP
jgi:hypothetical protein